jgi:prepilin-type N-terminal cleavage/methylation domain-containing protein
MSGLRERGLTLLEIIIALTLSAIVMALVGSLFIASLSTWRRGSHLREAQVQAGTLVEMIARDVRSGSQTPSLGVLPAMPADEGEPVLSILATTASPSGSHWIVYARRLEQHEVVRRTLRVGPDAAVTPGEWRVVATGVEDLVIARVGDGVSIEARVRRGRDVATSRATASPRNP